MKTKYERMSKHEKKEVYLEYKKHNSEFAKKMERMFLLCRIGLGYSVFMFFYDLFMFKNKIGYWMDIVIFVFCFIVLLKMNSTKKEVLNNFVLNNTKKRFK